MDYFILSQHRLLAALCSLYHYVYCKCTSRIILMHSVIIIIILSLILNVIHMHLGMFVFWMQEETYTAK